MSFRKSAWPRLFDATNPDAPMATSFSVLPKLFPISIARS